MKITNTKIKNACRKILSKRKDIEFAYLFGSRAKGRFNRVSDVDLAVFVNEKLDSQKRFSLRLELISLVGHELRRDNIDLVILNEAPLLLSFNVIKDGIIIFCLNESRRIHFEAKVMSRFYDQQYYLKRRLDLSISQIARGGLR